ncbi:hypothetical protein E3N88_05751 [Mikania micrantha]|uniref:Arabidopsis retrotransposon Orf1 C-terminal domain-containing protein n=1 Tax=Mikania micrantha TaxID=192012 RepID=A0A5N6PNN9_9ASTR|nr:hypothetical protein E3N88_05751 [Mikania micrantha]
MGGLPAYREIVLEFLSTFEFHPPQAGGMEALDQLPAVSFTLCGQDVQMSLTQWGIATGFYTRDEVTTPLFVDAAIEEDAAVLVDWWPVIGDEPFVNKARASSIRDPLHRYLHRCIACTITGRRLSQEWVTQKDLFFMYCLITGRSCNLAWLLADYFAGFISRKATGAITCGSFITRIARRIGRFSADIRDSMTVTYASTLLGRNTVMLMGIAADLPRVGLRWSLDRRTEWVPPVPGPQQQPGAQPHVQEPPADQDHADQPPPPPPPPAHHVVVRQPRLHPADAAILRDLVGSVRDLSGRVDRLEGMMRWMTERMAASAGMDIPVFPGPGHHQDPQDPGGHA